MKQMDVVNTDLYCFNKEKIISLTTNYNMIMGTFEYEQSIQVNYILYLSKILLYFFSSRVCII